MSYNKVVGKVRLRQLRVRRDGCSLSSSVRQSGTLLDGTARQRQLIDYCYPPYDLLAKDDQPFGPEELNTIDWKGFKYTTAEQNKLVGTSVQGQVTAYDGSGYVLDLDGANRTAYLETLQGLIDNKWIDKQARLEPSISVSHQPPPHITIERPLTHMSGKTQRTHTDSRSADLPQSVLRKLRRHLFDDVHHRVHARRLSGAVIQAAHPGHGYFPP